MVRLRLACRLAVRPGAGSVNPPARRATRPRLPRGLVSVQLNQSWSVGVTVNEGASERRKVVGAASGVVICRRPAAHRLGAPRFRQPIKVDIEVSGAVRCGRLPRACSRAVGWRSGRQPLRVVLGQEVVLGRCLVSVVGTVGDAARPPLHRVLQRSRASGGQRPSPGPWRPGLAELPWGVLRGPFADSGFSLTCVHRGSEMARQNE